MFEAQASPGGELRHGIPAFRLPAETVKRELSILPEMGVTFRFDTRIGEDVSLDALAADFDAVILAAGLNANKKLDIPGEGLPGVLDGMGPFVAQSAGKAPAMNGKVVIIGGGNVAVDTAMTALRRGASA